MFRTFERLTYFTALGIRFWDEAQDRQVRDGLIVTAWTAADPARVRKAVPTAGRIYAFHGLLRELEYGLAEIAPESRRVVVRVADGLGRYLPVVFQVDLPLPERGVFPQGNGTPLPGFFLLSAPSRRPPQGMAMVRAHLLQAGTQNPAAHVALSITAGGRTWHGLSDNDGQVAVLMPYPGIGAAAAGAESLYETEWPVTVQVGYAPGELTFPPGATRPDLRTALEQSTGRIQATAGNNSDTLNVTLRYDQELILRTQDESALWVTTSP